MFQDPQSPPPLPSLATLTHRNIPSAIIMDSFSHKRLLQVRLYSQTVAKLEGPTPTESEGCESGVSIIPVLKFTAN